MRILVLMLAAAACAPKPATTVVPPPTGPCNAAAVQDLIGQDSSKVLLDAQRRANAKAVRVYRTGSMTTMDYREDRLNLEVGADYRIVKVSCG